MEAVENTFITVHHKNLIQWIRFAGKLSDEKTGWITLVGNHQNPGRFWMVRN